MSAREPSGMRKPLLTEAVMFFSEQGISREMLYPEFEALLDGLVAAPECADETIEAVFLQINHRLHVRAAVFFLLDFDADGYVNRLWNMPLRNLAEKAERGPDMGGGPIRLACLGFCARSGYRASLWKPGQRAGKSDLAWLKHVVTRNSLGILGEDEETMAVLSPDNLQIAAEESWYADNAGSTAEQAEVPASDLSAELKALKQSHAAELAVLQQQVSELQSRLTVQEQVHIQQQQRLRTQYNERSEVAQGELLDIKKELAEQQRNNGVLRRELSRLQSRTPSDNQ